jgi:hypothetical protein
MCEFDKNSQIIASVMFHDISGYFKSSHFQGTFATFQLVGITGPLLHISKQKHFEKNMI